MSNFLSIIKPFILRIAISVLLEKVNVSELLAYIQTADKTESTNFGKRGYVYRLLKDKEKGLSEHVINTVLEMGVTLWKSKKSK